MQAPTAQAVGEEPPSPSIQEHNIKVPSLPSGMLGNTSGSNESGGSGRCAPLQEAEGQGGLGVLQVWPLCLTPRTRMRCNCSRHAHRSPPHPSAPPCSPARSRHAFHRYQRKGISEGPTDVLKEAQGSNPSHWGSGANGNGNGGGYSSGNGSGGGNTGRGEGSGGDGSGGDRSGGDGSGGDNGSGGNGNGHSVKDSNTNGNTNGTNGGYSSGEWADSLGLDGCCSHLSLCRTPSLRGFACSAEHAPRPPPRFPPPQAMAPASCTASRTSSSSTTIAIPTTTTTTRTPPPSCRRRCRSRRQPARAAKALARRSMRAPPAQQLAPMARAAQTPPAAPTRAHQAVTWTGPAATAVATSSPAAA